MTIFKTGDMVVCTAGWPTHLVKGQSYRIEDAYIEWGEEWVDLGHERGSYRAFRFRPETSAETICRLHDSVTARPGTATEAISRMATTDDPLRGSPAAPRPTALPDDNPKTRFGVAKPSVTLIPGPALIHCALAFRDGATKYGPANWRVDPVTASTYTDAAFRHLLDYWDGEDRASDSKVLHLAHAMACLAILIDAQEQGTLKDDRPTKGATPRVIEENTRPLT